MALNSLPVEYFGNLTFTMLPERVVIDGGPNGTRNIVTVTGATLSGPKINATLPEGVAAGDWATPYPGFVPGIGPASLDVRMCLRTDDNADIYTTYLGYMTDAKLKVSVRFETGDERYAWLNTAFVVGIMDIANGPPGYELYII